MYNVLRIKQNKILEVTNEKIISFGGTYGFSVSICYG